MRLFVLLTLFAFYPAALVAGPPEGSHIRTLDKRILAAMAEGNARSSHFRELVERVERGNVIAYIERAAVAAQQTLRQTPTWVTATKEFRYVRVAINPDLSGWSLTATIAHELQHVVEIGEAASIVDEKTMSAHYRDVGIEQRTKSNHWDTGAAQAIGEIVRRELASDSLKAEALQARALVRGFLEQD